MGGGHLWKHFQQPDHEEQLLFLNSDIFTLLLIERSAHLLQPVLQVQQNSTVISLPFPIDSGESPAITLWNTDFSLLWLTSEKVSHMLINPNFAIASEHISRPLAGQS